MGKFEIILIASLCCCTLARPQQNYDSGDAQGRQISRGSGRFPVNELGYEVIPIIRDIRNGPTDGVYDFEFETGNGIYREESGQPSGPFGSVVSRGSWAFTFPDGTPANFNFVANENGYQPESSHIHPMPAHALEQIARGERERAAGIVHDGQYDPARYGGGQWDPVRYGGGYYDQNAYGKK